MPPPSTKRARVLPIRPKHEAPLTPVHPFDRAYATDTGGLIPGSALTTGHTSDAHVTAYYAVAPSILESLLDLWVGTRPAFLIDQYTFLDAGAGKGRAIMVAAQHPFREAVGVELNPELARIAARNVAEFERCEGADMLAPARVVEGDVLEVPLPAGPVLAFLFHPFEAPLLRRFLRRMAQHCAGTALDVLYVNAEHAAVFDRDPAFLRVFYGMVPMSAEDHLADLAEIAQQKEYGSTGDELCAIYRLVRENQT